MLMLPIIASTGRSNSGPESNSISLYTPTAAGTNGTWHDECASTDGWMEQNASSGFDPKHEVFESGTLEANNGDLIVTGIADPVTTRKGPLFIKELDTPVPIDAIQLLQAQFSFTYASNVYGFLAVYLFDQNKQKAVMLRLHDAWAASESHPECVYFAPGETGDGTVHDEILFGSWNGTIAFWYDTNTGSLVGDLNVGTTNTATLKSSGQFDPERQVKYIGIQWSRHPGAPYDGDNYRLTDLFLAFDTSKLSISWLSGWSHRTSHEILATPGAGTDYQVRIVAEYGNGTSSGDTAYCNFACQPDFDDIRFTADDGITLLDYWRESYYDSDNATFWVKISDNLLFDAWVYMYYGNSTCSTTSNGTATFIFFDDFSGSSIDSSKWDAFGPWIEAGGVASFSITGNGGMSILPSLRTDSTWDMRNKSFVSRWRYTEKSVNREWGMSCANSIGADHTELAYFLANANLTDNIFVLYYDVSDAPGYDVSANPGPVWYEGQFYKTEFTSTPNGTLKNQWILDDNPVLSYSGYAFNDDPQYIFLGFYVYGYSNTLWSGNLGMEFDYIFLRKTVAPEPEQGMWSASPTTEPLISSPDDVSYEAGTPGNSITWRVENFDPVSYALYRDGVLLDSQTWPGGPDLTIDVNNLYPSQYNYTVAIQGSGGRILSDTVFVSVVDSTAPSLGHPSDRTAEYGSTVGPIQWSVSDLYPGNYTLFIDGIFSTANSWTSGSISLPIEELGLGEHIFSITVFDAFGNSVSDMVIVTVVDTTPPVISHPSDFTVTSGSTDIPFNWTATDLLPATYGVYLNGSLVDSGTWSSGVNITVTGLGTLNAGVYNYTLVVFDTSGNRAVDTVFVIVVQPWYAGGEGMIAIGVTAGGFLVIIIVGALILKNRSQQPTYSNYYYSR